MSDNRFDILNAIDALIAELSTPVSAEEAADGWNAESKEAIRQFFEKISFWLASEDENNIKKIETTSIMRSFDMWGISRGEILKKALRIMKAISALNAN